MSFLGGHLADEGTGDFLRVLPSGLLMVSMGCVSAGGIPRSTDTKAWTTANAGTASSISINNGVTLTAGTAASGYAWITSARPSVFVPGTACRYSGVVGIPGTSLTDPSCVAVWGAFDITGFDCSAAGGFGEYPNWFMFGGGFYFAWKDGKLSLVAAWDAYYQSIQASGGFNGDVASYLVDGLAHKYEILYDEASARFYVDGVLLGTIVQNANVSTSPNGAFYFSNLKPGAICFNRHTVTPSTLNQLYVYQTAITQYGGQRVGANWWPSPGTAGTTTLKVGPGILHRVIVTSVPTGGNTVLYDDTAATGGKELMTISTAGSYECMIPFANGLTYKANGTTSFATVVWE